MTCAGMAFLYILKNTENLIAHGPPMIELNWQPCPVMLYLLTFIPSKSKSNVQCHGRMANRNPIKSICITNKTSFGMYTDNVDLVLRL